MLGGTFAPAFAERRPGQVDGMGVLCNTAQMERVLRREIARADRGGRGFSLVLFRVKPGQSPATRLLADLLLKRARLTDEIGWFSENYLCAMLTGTPAEGARIFADGLCDAVANHAPRPVAVVYSYPSESAIPTGESAPALPRSNGHDLPAAHNGKPVNGRKNHNGDGASLGPIGLTTGSRHSGHNGSGPRAAVPSELIDFVQQGFETEMNNLPELPAQSVQELLTTPLPRWKRAVDILGAALGLLLCSPILFLAAIAVRLSSPGPIIFRQKRSGLGHKQFTMYKFRTMVNGAEAKRKELEALNEQDGPAFKLENDPRLTSVGKFLRKTSVDELPQLFNVLKGDMSLVGPRPLPCSEDEECLPWQRHRMNVTPGLTCIWQIKGRSRVTFDEWVRMDMAYINRRSLWKDLQIIFATIPAVLLRKGAK